MEPKILLAQIRALLERAPDFSTYSTTSRDHMAWLGQAHALLSRWDSIEAVSVRVACNFLSNPISRENSIAQIFNALHRAAADLELRVPSGSEVSFGAGDVYDFFKSLNKVIASAEKSLLIVDPYLDHSVFDHYLSSRGSKVSVRLLLNRNAEMVVVGARKYKDQYGPVLEMRKSAELHDRLIFVDGFVCWLIGQSLKDAAKAKPTYLVEAPPDVVSEKLQSYEAIWNRANVL